MPAAEWQKAAGSMSSEGRSSLPCDPECGSSLGRGGDAAAVARDSLGGDGHELGVAASQAVLVNPDIVLEPGANRVSAPGERPLHDLGLMASDSGRRPCRFRDQSPELSQQNVENMLVGRHCVLDAHDELHVGTRVDQVCLDQAASAMQMR